MRFPLVFTFGLLLVSGCATITSAPSEAISVTSEPIGANVSLDCGPERSTLITPARFMVSRRSSDCTLTLQKAGFEKESVVLEQGVNRWTWGNLPIAIIGITALGVSGFSDDPNQSARFGGAMVLVGLGGLVVDRMTWKLRDHDPKSLHVKLRQLPPETTATK